MNIALMQEFHELVAHIGLAFGVSAEEERQARMLPQRGRGRRSSPSREVLKMSMGIASVLGMWRREPGYVLADGSPKVLRIRGRRPSLESLAKVCTPGLSLTQLVQALCAQGDVTRLKANRVALIGDPAHITEKTSATSLAWVIRGLRNLAGTVHFNGELPSKERAHGRFERQILAAIPKEQFETWSRGIRKLLQETSDQVEEKLGGNETDVLSGKHKICGIGLYVFREDGELH